MATHTPRRPAAPAKTVPLETVDPRWLIKAFALTIVVAVCCAYLAVCLLVYQGGWQYFVKPSKIIRANPTIPFDAVRFDAATTGTPRLAGWWVPADSGASSARTILLLHDGGGNLSDTVAAVTRLHHANLNVFAFDYRGFGQSENEHPTETRMQEDSAAALEYLVSTRHIPVASIVPLGYGLGASLAANLAKSHPELSAIILDHPDPSLPKHYLRTGAHLLPMHLLVGDHFDITAQLGDVKRPKLFLAGGALLPDPTLTLDETLFHSAPDPKMSVTLTGIGTEAQYLGALNRFLDEYVHNP